MYAHRTTNIQTPPTNVYSPLDEYSLPCNGIGKGVQVCIFRAAGRLFQLLQPKAWSEGICDADMVVDV